MFDPENIIGETFLLLEKNIHQDIQNSTIDSRNENTLLIFYEFLVFSFLKKMGQKSLNYKFPKEFACENSGHFMASNILKNNSFGGPTYFDRRWATCLGSRVVDGHRNITEIGHAFFRLYDCGLKS